MKTNLKEKYKTIQKKEKIKTILKWVLCGVGWTSLLFVFVSSIVLGTKGCRSQQSKQVSSKLMRNDIVYKTQKEELPYKYYYRYEDNYTGPQHWGQTESLFHAQFDLRLKYKSKDIVGDNGFYRDLKYFALSVSNDGSTLIFDLYGSETNNQITTTNNYLYGTYFDGRDTIITNNIQIGFIDSSINLMNYDGNNFCIFFFSNIIKSNAVINMNYTFDFNYNINRYGPLMSNNEVFSNYGAENQLGSNFVVRGYFKDSLDNYYNAIKITYLQANGSNYIDSKGEMHLWDQNSASYSYLEYIRVDNKGVMVNFNDYITQGNKRLYSSSSTWVADSFRHITIFYLDNFTSNLPINDLSPLEVLNTFNNNVIGSNDMGGLGGSTGVFGLLSQGFKSVASILAMEIIPHISLGLFIFIPFSIMILITCVWLFKR